MDLGNRFARNAKLAAIPAGRNFYDCVTRRLGTPNGSPGVRFSRTVGHCYQGLNDDDRIVWTGMPTVAGIDITLLMIIQQDSQSDFNAAVINTSSTNAGVRIGTFNDLGVNTMQFAKGGVVDLAPLAWDASPVGEVWTCALSHRTSDGFHNAIIVQRDGPAVKTGSGTNTGIVSAGNGIWSIGSIAAFGQFFFLGGIGLGLVLFDYFNASSLRALAYNPWQVFFRPEVVVGKAIAAAAGFSPLQIGQARTLPSDPGGIPLGW